jgi:Protein of unknown function (DUF998)
MTPTTPSSAKTNTGMDAARLTRALLWCGVIGTPIFALTVLFQDYLVPGFDPRRLPLSALALGRFGWIQITNFALLGGLNVAYAVGIRRALKGGFAGLWAPIFLGLHGIFLIVVAINVTDLLNGWPTPASLAPGSPTIHGVIHALGALFVFMSFVCALFVFTRYFYSKQQRVWGTYSLVTAIVTLVLFLGGVQSTVWLPRVLRLAVLVGWSANTVIAARLMQRCRSSWTVV